MAVASSVVPTVSLAVSAVNPFNSLYLQGKSSVKLTATGSVSSAYGATIKSYTFTVTNASATVISTTSTSTSATSATHTSGVLTSSGTHTCRVTITDSRGRTATASRSITVTAYSKPVWGQVSAYRSDANGTSADEGTSIALTANASYSAVSGNSLTMTYQYKEATASSWSSSHSYTNGTLTVIGSAFDITKGYNIKVTATDTVGNTITTTVYVGTSAVGIDYDPVNNTLGLLRYAPTGSSDSVYMPKGYAYGIDGSTFSKLLTADIFAHGTQYIKLPGNLLIQWGQVGGYKSAKRDDLSVTLVQPYANTSYHVIATGGCNSEPEAYEVVATIYGKTTTGFTLHRANATSQYLNIMYWLAVGVY